MITVSVWLIVTLMAAGAEPVEATKSKQPNLQTCLASAARAIGKVTVMPDLRGDIPGTYRVIATCSVERGS
jgi:hypothetical protein